MNDHRRELGKRHLRDTRNILIAMEEEQKLVLLEDLLSRRISILTFRYQTGRNQ